MADTGAAPVMSGGNESWWRIKAGEPCHRKLSAHGKYLRQILRRVHQFDRVCEKIYENPRLRAYAEAIERLRGYGLAAARLNATKSVVDSYVSRIGKKRAMPAFSIDDADWSLKESAKAYRKWLIGKMTETEFDRLSALALKDSAITRAGITKIVDNGDDICAERVYANELLVDPREAQYGKPCQLIQVHRVARDWLMDRFPECKEAISLASHSIRQEWEFVDDEDVGRAMDLSGYVDVWEGWRLPSHYGDPAFGEDDDDDEEPDGIHALAVDTGTLVSEVWDRPRFPFGIVRYDHSLRGWWGKSLVMQCADLQHRVNMIVRDIQANLEVGGKMVVMVNEAFDIPVETMTGSAPFKFKYRGPQAPQWKVPDAVNMAHVHLLEFFIKQMYDLPGVSQAMATSRSSLGLNASGVALDTQYDIDSERFSQQEASYANYRLDCSQLYLDAARAIAKRREKDKGKKRSSVLVTGYTQGSRMERLEFAKVAMKEGTYKLRLEPVNFIPDTRAGKISAIQELTKAGVIPQWMAGAYFDEPDLARANKIAFGPFHNMERIMEGLANPKIDLGTLMPEGYWDLELALTFGKAYYNAYQAENAPEAVQSRFRTWIDDVIEFQDRKKKQDADKAAAVAGPAPPPGMAPPGAGPITMAPHPPGAGGPGLPAGFGPPNGVPVANVAAAPGAPLSPPPVAA
jgi:hypothetical protein